MALPQPNPARLSAPAPFFQDNSFVRGDQARNNNAAIWTDMEYLDGRCDTLQTEVDTVAEDLQEFIDNKASQAEAQAGVDNTKWMTPLRTLESIEANGQNLEKASQAEAQAGVDNTKYMTPLRVLESIIANESTLSKASQSEAEAGTNNDKYMTPLRVLESILYNAISPLTMQIGESMARQLSVVAAAEANPWTGVAFGNSVFVCVSETGTNRVMRSINYGATWSAVTAAESGTWAKIAFGNSVFVSVQVGSSDRIMRSTDNGATWSAVAGFDQDWSTICFANGAFVVFSSSGGHVLRSTDNGLTWAYLTAPESNNWNASAYGAGYVIAVSSTGTNRVLRAI